MSRKYRVRHETSYQYAADVVHSHHLLHLVPRPAPYQECLEHEIAVSSGKPSARGSSSTPLAIR